jgi:hypothetical protein
LALQRFVLPEVMFGRGMAILPYATPAEVRCRRAQDFLCADLMEMGKVLKLLAMRMLSTLIILIIFPRIIPAKALWTCNGFVPVTYLIKPPWLRTPAG